MLPCETKVGVCMWYCWYTNVLVANLLFVHNSGGRSVAVHVRRRAFWFISVRSRWGVWGKSRFPGTSTPVVCTRTVQVSARYRIKYDSSGSIAVRLARRQPAKCSGKNHTNVFLRLYPCTSAYHKHAVRFWKIHVNYRTVFCNRTRFAPRKKNSGRHTRFTISNRSTRADFYLSRAGSRRVVNLYVSAWRTHVDF